MELTKTERHRIYKEALLRFKECQNIGLCGAISYVTGEWYHTFDELQKMFPELAAKKPENIIYGWYWWGEFDMKPRIEALEECINETAP